MSQPSARRSFAARLTVILTAVLFGSFATVAAPRAALAADPVTPTEGIDVSHWQGTIDWTQVASAGKRFVFMKASEDIDYVDPTYGLNRARAMAAGLVVGAYHFAQPDATPGDAVAEADHFLDTAGIASGDLPPVLDLERSGDLTPIVLQQWVAAFLGRIHERTGVRAVIYTSPSFWSTYLAGTDWFATNGYRVVWVAHWTSGPTPTVPAADWAGFSWTFWQYTSSGTVAGITGRVDLDRFAGSDFSAVRIDPDVDGGGNIPATPPFTDIRTSAFKADIAWLYAQGITSGCSATTFCPKGNVSRGQMASFLARALQLPSTSKDYFKDDDGSVHERDINRLAKAGLTTGCSATRYCPNTLVTRAQLATFLARVLDLSTSAKDYFKDDSASSHEPDINKIARAGLTSGCGPARYCPSGIVSRGQMAAFLHRTFGY